MKKAEEYYNDTLKWREGNNGGIQRHKPEILDAIKQAQLDAIEEAVKRCANEPVYKTVGTHNPTTNFLRKEIFKVAKQLRKEIE